MPTVPRLAIFTNVQLGITQLLTVFSNAVIDIGFGLWFYFFIIMIATHGIVLAWRAHRDVSDNGEALMWLFVKGSLIYMFLSFYSTPMPFVGQSFTGVILNGTSGIAAILNAGTVDAIFTNLATLWAKFVAPGAWSFLAIFIYVILIVVLILISVFVIGVLAFGLIAAAVFVLLGPIFLPFLLLPWFDKLFWGWLWSLLEYAFVPVFGMGYLYVAQHFMFGLVTDLPARITEDQYPLYFLEVALTLGALGFGVLRIPSLAKGVFSGSAGGGDGGLVAGVSAALRGK